MILVNLRYFVPRVSYSPFFMNVWHHFSLLCFDSRVTLLLKARTWKDLRIRMIPSPFGRTFSSLPDSQFISCSKRIRALVRLLANEMKCIDFLVDEDLFAISLDVSTTEDSSRNLVCQTFQFCSSKTMNILTLMLPGDSMPLLSQIILNLRPSTSFLVSLTIFPRLTTVLIWAEVRRKYPRHLSLCSFSLWRKDRWRRYTDAAALTHYRNRRFECQSRKSEGTFDNFLSRCKRQESLRTRRTISLLSWGLEVARKMRLRF